MKILKLCVSTHNVLKKEESFFLKFEKGDIAILDPDGMYWENSEPFQMTIHTDGEIQTPFPIITFSSSLQYIQMKVGFGAFKSFTNFDKVFQKLMDDIERTEEKEKEELISTIYIQNIHGAIDYALDNKDEKLFHHLTNILRTIKNVDMMVEEIEKEFGNNPILFRT